MEVKLIENVDFYYGECGFVIITEQCHLNRGYCCGYGCKHCPYDYESVPEPKRSSLIASRDLTQGTKGITTKDTIN